MQPQIERELSRIVGMPLRHIKRASNMLMVDVGEPRAVQDPRGRTVEEGEYAIHVQCAWRIVDERRILVASGDFYVASSSYSGDSATWDWDVPGHNLFDERVGTLFRATDRHPVVDEIHVDRYGGFQIEFTDGTVLETFPASSEDSEYAEAWRLFRLGDDGAHFVVTYNGIAAGE